MILLPFWANSHTRFLADKVMPFIMGTGIKLSVLAFILSIAIPYVAGHIAVGTALDMTSGEATETLGTSMALAFLAWRAPNMAAGLMNGLGSGNSAASVHETQQGLSDMSSTMGNAGMGGGLANMMGGVTNAMKAATGKALGNSTSGGTPPGDRTS